MADLVFSKQIKERQKFFPWLKVFQRKLLKIFPNDLNFDVLQFLLQNVEEEVTALPNSGKAKRKEALFATIYDLFLHFWWRIHWKGRKKWSRCWKNVSSDISYTKDERSKCCEKLLCYIIHLGITLSKGCSDSEWIGKVFQAIHVLPSFDSMIYDSLLQVKRLSNKYSSSYIAILRHVLCTEIIESITEPATYIKIMLLLKRLKTYTNDGFTISAIESAVLRIKPPSDVVQWMSSQAIDFPLEKHESFGKEFLNNKSKDLLHKLRLVVTAPVESEEGIHIQQCQNEGIETQLNKAKVKKCKHKKKSHSKLKFNDSQLNLSVDRTSKVSSSSNCKVQANTIISKKSKKDKNLKMKRCPKSNFLDKKLNNRSPKMTEATAINEFLNFSFAEISNFSKRLVSQKQNLQNLSERINGIESNVPKKGALANANKSAAVKNVTSYSNEELDQAQSCDGPSSNKKIKLVSNEKFYKENQSIQKSNLQEPAKITCLNSFVTLSSNELNNSPINTSETLTNACCNKTTYVSDQDADFSQNFSPDYQCSSNGHLFDTRTSVNRKSSSQTQTKQTSPDKIQLISSVDVQNIQPSALFKLVHLPNEDSTSRHCETSTNVLCESINSNQIHENTNNQSMPVPESGSSSIIRAPQRLKVRCDLPPNIFLEKSNTTQMNKATDSTELIGGMYLSKNVNESNCRNDKINFKHPTFGSSSVDLCNSLNHHASSVENKSNNNSFYLKGFFDDHRWGESQPLIPTIDGSLESAQNCSVNRAKSSCMNSEGTNGNSFVIPRTESRLSNITVSQNDTSPNCVVDCKIVSDYEPNIMQNESVTSIKLVINVSCKTPEDTSNQQSERIFGNFNNTSENYFDSSFNLFSAPNPTPEMPKLTPFYDDPPILTADVDAIATPPDSELDISIPTSSSKQDEFETLTHTLFETPQNDPNCSSTPKDAQNSLLRRISKAESDFRTPQTSDCESYNECNEENVNLTNSLVTHTSAVKSPVDDILERLNYRICLPTDESESHNITTVQNASKENVSYRSSIDVYSYEELSEDSTISTVSRVSATDDELNKSINGQKLSSLKDAPHTLSKGILSDETNIEVSDINKQRPLNVLKKRRKNVDPKKYSEGDGSIEDVQEKIPCNFPCGYTLRPRAKLKKPSNLEDFF